MEINFKELQIEVNFDEYVALDVTKIVGNTIHSMTNDIGLDDFAREIYHSNGSIEVPAIYISEIIALMKSNQCKLVASVKRAIIDKLSNN